MGSASAAGWGHNLMDQPNAVGHPPRMSQRTALNRDQMTLEHALRSAGDPLPNARRDDGGPLDAISRPQRGRGHKVDVTSWSEELGRRVTESDGHHADPDRQRAEPVVRPSGCGPAVRRASRPPNLEIGARIAPRANQSRVGWRRPRRGLEGRPGLVARTISREVASNRAEANCAYRAASDREQAAARDLESLSQLAHAA